MKKRYLVFTTVSNLLIGLPALFTFLSYSTSITLGQRFVVTLLALVISLVTTVLRLRSKLVPNPMAISLLSLQCWVTSGLIGGLYLLFFYPPLTLLYTFLIGVFIGIFTSSIQYHIALQLSESLELEELSLSLRWQFALALFVFFLFFGLLLVLIYGQAGFVQIAVVTVLSFILSYVLSLFFFIPILNSIKRIRTRIDQLATEGGDISQRLFVRSGNEIGRLAASINNLLDSIESIIKSLGGISFEISERAESLSSATEEMNASLEEVSSTVQHIAKGSQEQSASISNIAKALDDYSKFTVSVTSQVKMTVVSSTKATKSAEEGMALSKTAAEISQDIFEHNLVSQERMALLKKNANEIRKVLDIIRSFSDQTDLLALNSAIEAARLGEAGRGFAVVADEIRNLANEIQKSSETVGSVIAETERSIDELSDSLNIERDRVARGRDINQKSEEHFVQITRAVSLANEMVKQISSVATRQVESVRSLLQAIEDVAKVATDTASSTEQVASATQEQTASMEELSSTAQALSQMSVKLTELVKKFGA